ncbi:unnamed protein product [Urochloa decumbens]|uniref:SAM domain-containing protein n=1 Tax=Urochloa decumbens TaxID=240449 RepID=A0ABC9DW72_9POAL
MDWYAWMCRAGLHPDVALEYALLFARNELGADDLRHLDHDLLATMGVAVAKHRLEILKLARKESSSHSRAAAAAAAITALPWRATRLLAAAVHRSARSALGRLRASVSPSAAPSHRGLDRALTGTGSKDRAAVAVAAAAHALATPRRTLPAAARRRGGRVAHSWGKVLASPVAARGGKPSPLPLMLTHVEHVSEPVVLTSSCAATAKALPAPPDVVAGCLAAATEACVVCDEDGDDAGDADMEEEVDGGGDEEMRWESMFQNLKPT